MDGWSRLTFWAVSALLVSGAFIWASWRLLGAISAPVERDSVDFLNLERTGRPNDYLVCPKDLCGAEADEISPVFDVPVSQLSEEWFSLVSTKPRTKRLSGFSESQYMYEQRSRWLGFPDTITIRFYQLGQNRSTLALYSRSHYGYWDLGVNRKRVQDWLNELNQVLK